jgi:hypothetical protein
MISLKNNWIYDQRVCLMYTSKKCRSEKRSWNKEHVPTSIQKLDLNQTGASDLLESRAHIPTKYP